ncbi:D-xylose ABC transporter substrate-binding protein [Siminovitchia terrae]|uniref:D-xylose ABC transporter substrate-binding protein n=1 Tax=Siminovitchia terrae TaxID=1914933 RepID=A0ABQ4L304_SIMTE|nr:substrate-binding domain-containing protein [Siminovitchia terrae]GIN91705.1 D-xylose ABC transporter substrate-binding protein [Siminovitchia terrae]GIN98367.1 D-xylose ABC transporter substrate-binding protein [Siminovitchia terrae]
MKSRHSFLFTILLASIVFMAGCIQSEEAGVKPTTGKKNDDDIVIGFSVGTTKQERWQREVEMAKEFAAKNGFELMVQSAEEDASKQVKQVENLITKGMDVLLISAQDSESAGAVVDVAHEAGVPVVAYDRLVKNGDLDYYVTFDTEKVGELQAKSLVEQYPKGNYIWLLGGPEDFNAHLIKQGHEKVLKPLIDKGNIKVVTQQWAKGWSPEEALKHTENGLTAANNDVVAVLASNDGTAGGAVQALEAQGLSGKVGVSGQDAALEGVQRVVAGIQTSTVYKPLKELNTHAMELVYALAKGDQEKADEMVNGKTDNGAKEVPSILIDVQIVTKENMVDTVIKDGFHTMEDVYKNIPKEEWPKDN